MKSFNIVSKPVEDSNIVTRHLLQSVRNNCFIAGSEKLIRKKQQIERFYIYLYKKK